MPTNEQLNIVGKISHFFAVHRPLSVLLLVVTLVFGLLAFFLTPKQYNPEIVRPAFSVSIAYIGATQEEAIDRVVYELVEKIVTVPGVDDVHTTVTDDVQIQTTVIFEVGYDATKAKVDLLSQIQQYEYLARGFIENPTIIEINPETIPILQMVFGSDVLPIDQVRKQVNVLSHELTNIKSVSQVELIGGYNSSLVLELDPVQLRAQHVSVSDVLQTLKEGQTRFVSAGFTGDTHTIEFVFDGRVDTAEQVGLLEVSDGLLIRDIASVYEGASSDRGYVLHDTAAHEPTEVVMLAVSKVEGASAPVVTKDVRAAIDEILKIDAYTDLSYAVVSDDGVTATKEIFGLTKNLITSISIVVLVLLLFLSFRAAAVVFVAIPVTLLIVFGVGLLFDQTINRITLFALILSLGLLVDSAIVVVENIYGHLKQMRAQTISATRETIIAGAVHEIGVGLLLSTVTSVIVFLPMRYITGMMGPYMGPIAFFVPAALIISLMVAIVITPFVATYVLQVTEKKSVLTSFVDDLMQRLTKKYKRVLQSILSSRKIQKFVLLGALGMFVLSLALPMTGLVHFQMLPRADRDQFYVYLDAPVDTSTEYTRAIATDISGLLTQDPDVVSVQQFIAQAPAVDFNGMFKGAQNRTNRNQATLRVNVVPAGDRDRSSTDIVTEVRAQLAQTYTSYVPMVRFIEEPPGPPVPATLVAKLSSVDTSMQTKFADDFYLFLKNIDGVVDRDLSTDESVGRIVYRFNQEKASLYGVSADAVADALRLISGPYMATEYLATQSGEFSPVVLSLPHKYVDAPADFAQVQVRANDGTFVSVLSVVDVSYEERPSLVSFEDTQLVTYVTAETQDRSIVYVVIDIMHQLIAGNMEGYTVAHWGLFAMELVDTAGDEFALEWGGEWEMTLENFRDLGLAMGVALLLVYAVLVAQYNSFSKPAYILVTVPLGLVGILWGFLFLDTFFGIYLTATALIGFIALIGLVVNNAIIYLEYVEQSQQRGLSFEASLLEAGGARLRPIFLTSLTTILGSLTIVNDPVWSGLAWAIIFGLSLSTVLTLIIYPTLLVYFHTKEQ